MQPKILVIGSKDHDRAYCVDWQQPFPNIEEFDSIIINLTSFPKNQITRNLVDSLGELSEATRTFMATNREIFCILDEPIFLEGISKLNYVWFPEREKLSVIRKKPGKSKIVEKERFAEYLEFVEK